MGKSYPQVIRENILDLHNNGLSIRQISAQARVSTGFITKVIKEYNENNYSVPRRALSGCKESVLTENVRSYLEVEMLCKPSLYSDELQRRLLLDGVCLPGEVPSNASVPLESTEGPNIDGQNAFLAEISRLDPSSLHFFEETSVIRTEGNRKYDNSFIGERALEYQKYASNATYTVNLLHSALRVDHYNIIDGPSNGNEMLLFFEDAPTMDNPDGSAVLERGDTVVMDNCGFHHGHFAEGMLRDMFVEYGVRLLFQPAYCPHLNTCELCFNQLKSFLPRFTLFAQQETRTVIAEGISSITQQNCVAYFKCCGYL
ncbi:uncharacterized protein [Acropora muricata]|uniref:uncharacterized protein n=1 Tax=Acropora muricata TaxID=159855 RepID=UPI0034E57D30